METNEDRKARLLAELHAIEHEDREHLIDVKAAAVGIGDVVAHLVMHSAGFPTADDREVFHRVVRKEFGLGEYAQDTQAAQPAPVQAPDGTAGA